MSESEQNLSPYNSAAIKLAESASAISTALPKLAERVARLEVEISTFGDIKLKHLENLLQSEVVNLERSIKSEIGKIEANIHDVLPSVRREVDRVESTNRQVLDAIESRLQGVRDSLDGVWNGSTAGFQGFRDSLDGVRQGSESLANKVENRLNSLATKDDLILLKEEISALKAMTIRPIERIMIYIAGLTAVITFVALIISAISIWGTIRSSFQPSVQQVPSQSPASQPVSPQRN